MISDPIADMLIRIKNGYMSRKSVVKIPHSNVKQALAQVLQKHNYVGKVTREGKQQFFQIELLYKDGQPVLTEVLRQSKPGLRRYIRVRDLSRLNRGLGHVFLSTPRGLMTHKEAQKEGVGGEVLCIIW